MKKVLLIVLCFAIPMVGFAQKKKKKGAEPEVIAPVEEKLDSAECIEKISLFQQFVKMGDWTAAYENWLPVYQSRPDFRNEAKGITNQLYTNGAKIMEYRWCKVG